MSTSLSSRVDCARLVLLLSYLRKKCDQWLISVSLFLLLLNLGCAPNFFLPSDIGSSSRPLSQSRSRNRPPPLTPGQATKLSGSSSSHQRHGPCSTPTPPRSSFSTESTADSLRSRSLTVSSDNTTVYSGSQSFDQGTRPLKSHSTSSHRPHPGQRFGFPMPPTSTTAASSPLVPNDAIVWPNHHPTQPFNPSVSQSVVSVHEEPQSFLPRDTEYQSRRLANSGGSGSSHGGGGGSDSGSGSGSGWKAIARKASGKFKRSFSSSGSMINLAQEAEKHPMPTPPGSTVVTPTIEKTEPPGEATASTSPSPVSGSGFIGHMLSRKKSRDSLSDSGGRKPRPSWSDLPPSPSAPSTSAQTSSKPQPSTSSHGSGRTLKFGKSKQRWDQVPVSWLQRFYVNLIKLIPPPFVQRLHRLSLHQENRPMKASRTMASWLLQW